MKSMSRNRLVPGDYLRLRTFHGYLDPHGKVPDEETMMQTLGDNAALQIICLDGERIPGIKTG